MAKYKKSLIKEYSKRLTTELGKGYSTRVLKKMRIFYMLVQKGPTLSALFENVNITWSNVCEIIKNIGTILQKSILHNLEVVL